MIGVAAMRHDSFEAFHGISRPCWLGRRHVLNAVRIVRDLSLGGVS